MRWPGSAPGSGRAAWRLGYALPTMTSHTHPHIPSAEEMALLPAFPRLGLAQITLVKTASEARLAWGELRHQRVWGFDTESKPTFFKDQVSDGPHVLQLATADHAWVFQLDNAYLSAEVSHWLADPKYLKAGFGLGDDTKRLRRKFGVEPQGVVELNNLFRQRGYRREMGVKAAVAVLFGQCFAKSKKAATSNWSVPDLSESQLMYAANDAHAAACVYHALQALPMPTEHVHTHARPHAPAHPTAPAITHEEATAQPPAPAARPDGTPASVRPSTTGTYNRTGTTTPATPPAPLKLGGPRSV